MIFSVKLGHVATVLGVSIGVLLVGCGDSGNEETTTPTATPNFPPLRRLPPPGSLYRPPANSATKSPAPASTPTPTPAPKPSPAPSLTAADEAEITHSFEELLGSYNGGEYIQATAQVDSSLDDRCGGPRNHADAYRQNHQVEGIDYSLISLKITEVISPRAARADVDVRESYAGGSNLQGYGLRFVRNPAQGWVLGEDFPIAISVFC
jgi:hypothetical protein